MSDDSVCIPTVADTFSEKSSLPLQNVLLWRILSIKSAMCSWFVPKVGPFRSDQVIGPTNEPRFRNSERGPAMMEMESVMAALTALGVLGTWIMILITLLRDKDDSSSDDDADSDGDNP